MSDNTGLLDENLHHAHSSMAVKQSKESEKRHKEAEEMSNDLSLPAEIRREAAMIAAASHGSSEVAHLRAAKHQHQVGNHELARTHVLHAQTSRAKRAEWHERASAADEEDRAQKFPGQEAHRLIHFSQPRPPGEVSHHPYDIHRDWENNASHLGLMADSIPPHDARSSGAHHSASEAYGKAASAALRAAEVTGDGTDDHAFYMHKHMLNKAQSIHHEKKSASE